MGSCAFALLVFVLRGGSLAADLPAGLDSPDYGVVCNRGRGVCFDRYGPSIGLTEVFLGKAAAERLTGALREAPPDHRPGAVFAPAEGVECRREEGPCRADGEAHAWLTAALYGPRPPGPTGSAEARAAVGVDWRWRGTSYGDGTAVEPGDPGRYLLRLEPDGALRVRADCNGAGGRYHLGGGTIAIEITHSTMAACEPDSLERVFLRDLAGAAGYFLRGGGLHLDLRYDSGTMRFEQ